MAANDVVAADGLGGLAGLKSNPACRSCRRQAGGRGMMADMSGGQVSRLHKTLQALSPIMVETRMSLQ
jgi:hypothetical protein